MTLAMDEDGHAPLLPKRARLACMIAAAASIALAGCAGSPSAQRGYAVGSNFKDCAACPEMIVVPPGTFQMGRDGGTEDENRYQGPVRTVKIGYRFALGRTEVTNAQYAAFVQATGHKNETPCNTWSPEARRVVPNPEVSWSKPGYVYLPNQPVACVSWTDAKAYLAWLSEKTGETYRLPSEAEWEYAARAGETGLYIWGDDASAACRFANVYDQSADDGSRPFRPLGCDDGFAKAAPVAQFAPNAFGLHDMSGNVWEWVEDCYQMPYPPTPVDGSPQLSQGCDRRGVKGGSWGTNIVRHMPTFRGRDPVGLTTQLFGFRVARDVPQ
jgi:formylglycine-generating enzyme required for sulfatase activity